MYHIVLSGLLLAVTFAVAFSELCSPDQWEGTQVSFGTYSFNNKAGSIKEFNKLHYDSKNKRRAATIHYVNGDFENTYKMVFTHTKDGGKAYMVDLKSGICYTQTTKGPFLADCIPEDAKAVDSYHLGPKQGGLLVSGYRVEILGVPAYMGVTKVGDRIIPVLEQVKESYYLKDLTYSGTSHFADITPGIANASVFDIPKQCAGKESEDYVHEFMNRKPRLFGL